MVACTGPGVQDDKANVILSFRSNKDGSLLAAYLGACRVGYLQRSAGTWLWTTTLVRPEGSAYVGRALTEDRAKDDITEAVMSWTSAAGLQKALA